MMTYFNNVITLLFTNIFIISLQTAVVSLVVLFISKIFKKQLSPRLSYLLWVLVLIRLVIPVLPQSPISIFNAFDVKAFVFSMSNAENNKSAILSETLYTENKLTDYTKEQANIDAVANWANNADIETNTNKQTLQFRCNLKK